MEAHKKRIFWCDGVRAIAILLVLLNHSLEYVVDLSPQRFSSYEPIIKYSATLVFLLGRLGVPFFLFLTGYLILSKSLTNLFEIKNFYKKNLLSMIVTMELWIVFIYLFLFVKRGVGAIDYSQIPLAMLFLEQVPYIQMWYLPFIVGIYLGLPFLACIVKNIPKEILGIFLCVITVVSMGAPSLEIFTSIIDPYYLKNTLYGIGYNSYCIPYLVCGYFLGQNEVKLVNKLSTKNCLFFSIFFFLINWQLQVMAIDRGLFKFGYNQIFGFLASIFAFIYLLRLLNLYSTNKREHTQHSFLENLILTLSTLSFAAFFLHAPLQEILLGYLYRYTHSKIYLVVFLFFSSVIVTNLLLFYLFRIRIVRKIIFNKN